MAEQQILCPGCGSSAWDDLVVTAVGIQATCMACQKAAFMNTPRKDDGQTISAFESLWRE